MRLALAGDTMLGRKVARELERRPPQSLVEPALAELTRAADLFVLNLECCISERGASGLGEVGKALDAEHLASEPREQRRLPAVAGADLEHALVARERERLDHPRDKRRLSGDLPVRNRDRRVDLRQLGVFGRHELRAGHD